MSKFSGGGSAYFTRSRTGEAFAEVGLAAGAAAFTAALWLSVGAFGVEPRQAVVATTGHPVTHVTLPTVHIVGRRDTLDGTPVTTTAQNTSANIVTLSQ